MIRVLADDMMPGVEECLSQWRDRHGQTPHFELVRKAGRAMGAADLANIDMLLVRSITRVDADLLRQANALRFVGSATIGQDHLSRDALAQANIAWSTAPGCNAQAVAEWVLATVLREASRTPHMTLAELRLKRVAVVGMGQVGRRVAALLSALGLQVTGCDPLLDDAAKVGLAATHWDELNAILANADIICLHTPLTRDGPEATYHMLDAKRLALLKPSAWLINAGRGDVIAGNDLAAYLQQPQAATALLDVLPNEPVPELSLIEQCQQVSPHIAGHSLEGKWRGTWQITCRAAEIFGFTVVGDLSALLPGQAPPPLRWPAHGNESCVTPYATLLAQVIDCAGDDQRLRAAVAKAPGEPSAFDNLRKQYATRRELAAHTVAGVAKNSSAQQLLTALGFCC